MDGEITVGWLDDQQKTKLLRDKESAADYRYFPEPDIPPITVSKERVAELKAQVPELPLAKRRKFIEKYGVSEEEALFFSEDPQMATYFETVAEQSGDHKKTASFVGTVLLGKLKNEGETLGECKVKATQLAELIKLITAGDISNNVAKTTVFDEMFATGKDPQSIVEEKGLKQVSDTGAIEAFVDQVIAENPGPVADVKAGTEKAIGFLVGQVMKLSKGQANPGMVNQLLREKLK